MLGLITSLVVVLGFAWLARALLDAREMTWGRLSLAAIVGVGIGDFASLLLVTSATDIASFAAAADTFNSTQFRLVALPFQVIGTMGAIVVLELLFSRPPSRHRRARNLLGPIRALRRGGGIVLRAIQVMRIATRYGLAPLLGLRSGSSAVRSPEDLARRARLALEEAGGMFIKLGQLLATRPDLMPEAATTELGRLHSVAAPLTRDQVEAVLGEELQRPVGEVFAHVEWTPLGSASIGQAHAARLIDGSDVVVKLRRPGLTEVVERDLAIAAWLARIAQRRTVWGRTFDLRGLAAEFSRTLRAELDFRIEGRRINEVATAVRHHALVHVPRVIESLATSGMLVMEHLAGTPLSQLPRDHELARPRELADALCASQVTAMLQGERFHGDPHPGNILLLDDGRLGLIDMGITGRLDVFERASVFQMLVAIRLEQPTLLYESMVSIGAVDPGVHDPDKIERALAGFMAAYLAPGLPPPEALTDLLRLTNELGLRLPRSTTAMFRALTTLTGTLEHLSPGYPVIDAVAELGGDEFRRRLMPESATEYIQQEWAQLGPLLGRLPRHVDRLATLAESGRLTTRLRLFSDPDERHFLEAMLNRMVLTILAIGTAAVSVMLFGIESDPEFAMFHTGLFEVLGWIGLFIATTLLLRVLLAVLRSEAAARSP